MALIELPKIPQDFENMLFASFMEFLGQEAKDFVGDLAAKYQQDWTDQLQKAVPGKEFLMFTVTRTDLTAPTPTVTLLLRFTNKTTKLLPQLKLALARAEIRIEPWVTSRIVVNQL